MFFEFFVKMVMKDFGVNFSEILFVYVMKSESGLKKSYFILVDEVIEIWYIKEYGLVIF